MTSLHSLYTASKSLPNTDKMPVLFLGHESPLIDVHLVVGKEKISGAGECGVPPLAPALANALFAAMGKRVYNLPLMNNGFSTAPAA